MREGLEKELLSWEGKVLGMDSSKGLHRDDMNPTAIDIHRLCLTHRLF